MQAGSRAPLLSWAQMRRYQTPSKKLRWQPVVYHTLSCAQVSCLLLQCCAVQHYSAPLVQAKVVEHRVSSCMP